MSRSWRAVCPASLLLLAVVTASPASGGFSGKDLFIPSVAHAPGQQKTTWFTDVWVYNPNDAPVQVSFYLLERDIANTGAVPVTETIQAGDTKVYEDIVASMFGKEVWGAMRIAVAEEKKVVVSSRLYNQLLGSPTKKDSAGQDFAGVPASFAIGKGEKTSILGSYSTLPLSGSDFRTRFGFVEVTGKSVKVRVTPLDETGAPLASGKDHTILAYSQRQFLFESDFPTVTTENARLQVEAVDGSGKAICYGMTVANGTIGQDPTTFEMQYADALLGISTVQHDASLSGDGTAGAPLGIAPSATVGQVLTTVAGASAAAGDGAAAFAANAVAWRDAASSLAPSGPAGGALSGSYPNPGIAAGVIGSSQLAPGAVTTEAIADGSIAAADVGFNYAASDSKGGAARDLECSGCVGFTDVTTFGAHEEEVLKYRDGKIEWANDRVMLPFQDSTMSLGVTLFHVANGGDGGAIVGMGGAFGVAGHGQTGVQGEGDVYGVLAGTNHTAGVGTRGQHVSGNFGCLGSAEFGAYGANANLTIYGYLNNGVNGAGGRNGANWGRVGTPTHAGYFNGPMYVSGAITKPSGGFQIDHPLDPENKVLNHSFVESPDMKNVYDGVVTTDQQGLAIVSLPGWFEALNRNFRYQLTVIGRFAQAIVEQEVEDNRFTIRTNLGNVKVSWQVTGIRKDAWAEAHRIQVEEDKPESERGTYLHPEVHGQPAERSVEWVRSPDMMRPPAKAQQEEVSSLRARLATVEAKLGQ